MQKKSAEEQEIHKTEITRTRKKDKSVQKEVTKYIPAKSSKTQKILNNTSKEIKQTKDNEGSEYDPEKFKSIRVMHSLIIKASKKGSSGSSGSADEEGDDGKYFLST